MDAEDQCPTEPGPANRQGCPFRDQDTDGVEDSHDKCPAEAGLLELKGCPAKDTDGDGVADHLDNCPAEKGVPENQGCPKKKTQLVVITRDRLVIKDKVYFATGKSKILPRSFPLLNQVADVINGHPEIARVVVEGHTDSVGKPETNRKLSQDRANSVMTYLVGRKVDAARLSARGYGPDKPAAPNDTAAGREQNRRVEFTLPGADEGGAP
jgi:outer membrane protein OmpA-like peptidoglycan-associated protein